jgi:PAS domain-containing protein
MPIRKQKQEPHIDWASLYQSAMLELDYDKLPSRIIEARDAIGAARSSQSASFGVEELRSMNDALHNLRILEEELKAAGVPREHMHQELAGEYVAMVNPSRHYVAVTDGVCKLLGFSRGELLTKKIDDVTAPTTRQNVPQTFRKYVDLGYMTGTHELLHRTGTIISIRYEAKVFPDGCLVARWTPE